MHSENCCSYLDARLFAFLRKLTETKSVLFVWLTVKTELHFSVFLMCGLQPPQKQWISVGNAGMNAWIQIRMTGWHMYGCPPCSCSPEPIIHRNQDRRAANTFHTTETHAIIELDKIHKSLTQTAAPEKYEYQLKYSFPSFFLFFFPDRLGKHKHPN